MNDKMSLGDAVAIHLGCGHVIGHDADGKCLGCGEQIAHEECRHSNQNVGELCTLCGKVVPPAE